MLKPVIMTDHLHPPVEFAIKPPNPKEPLAIVDIGAGASTVAVAVSEAWPKKLGAVSYYAVEPHSDMRCLGRSLLTQMDLPFSHISAHQSTKKLVDALTDTKDVRILVTLSYVVHQSSVTEQHVRRWVRDIYRWSSPSVKKLEILATTASSQSAGLIARDSSPVLREELRKIKPQLKSRTRSFSCDRCFPGPHDGSGWTRRLSSSDTVRCMYWVSSRS